MARLLIVVPAGREHCGSAVLFARDGTVVLGPFRVLATASRRVAAHHGNASCDKQRPFGHPAAGTYAIASALPPGARHRRQRRFGSLGAFLLKAMAGPAVEAAAHGRGLIALHGGPLDRKDRLRPTRGGLRVADRDLKRLFESVNGCQEASDPVESIELIESPASKAAPARADLPGGRRYRLPESTAAKEGALPVGVLGAGLIGVWLRGRPVKDLDRRSFLAAALAAVGSLTLEACGPSPCEPGASGVQEVFQQGAGGQTIVHVSGPGCADATYDSVDGGFLLDPGYAVGGGVG